MTPISAESSAWLGAMVYSLFVLHPQAHRYFRTETEFEAFIVAVSGGARWKVLLALCLVVGLEWTLRRRWGYA